MLRPGGAKRPPTSKKEERPKAMQFQPAPATLAPPNGPKGCGKGGKDKETKGKVDEGEGKAEPKKLPKKPKVEEEGNRQVDSKAPGKGNPAKATYCACSSQKGPAALGGQAATQDSG